MCKMLESSLKESLKELLLNDDNMLMQTVSVFNSYDDSFDHLEYYENDEDFLNEHFSSPAEAIRAAQYGHYSFGDEYVRFNAYGNLVSKSEGQIISEMQGNINEIVDYILENYDYLTFDSEIENMIEDYNYSQEEA